MLLETLQNRTNVSRQKLLWIAETASHRYKLYEIPKRSGGMRVIHHPSKELKALQRWISRAILRPLPVHPRATAYKKGARIRENAAAHLNSNYTLRVDFSDFFPSFTRENISTFIENCRDKGNIPLSDNDIDFSSRIFTRFDQLTIGAPSSPILTNVMMYEFDSAISEFCSKNFITYTRYADDLFFSSNIERPLNNVEEFLRNFLRNFKTVNLSINEKKTIHMSRKMRRRVTGIVITPDNKLSIGRAKKREIKALVHQFILKKISLENAYRLMGLIAFAMDCEPEFFLALTRKYGVAPINEILNRSIEIIPAP